MTIAVIGASNDRSKFGNKAVRAFRDKGFTVYPVNPTEKEIEGLTAYPSITEIPVDTVDIVTVYLAPPRGLKVIEAVAAKKPKEVWLNPGADGPEVIAKGKQLGLNMIPACSLVGYGLRPYDY